MSVDALRPTSSEVLAVHGLPGLAVAVTDRDGLVASETFGLANLDAGTPVTTGDVLRDRLDRQDVHGDRPAPAARGGPRSTSTRPSRATSPGSRCAPTHAPITIHHLLTHTSGLMVGAELSANSRFDVWALREIETGFAPGSALPLLERRLPGPRLRRRGADRDRRTRRSCGTRILEPLGLEATDPAVTSDGRRRLAVAYERLYDDRPARPADPWVPATWLETGTGDGSPAAAIGGSRRVPARSPEPRRRPARGGARSSS